MEEVTVDLNLKDKKEQTGGKKAMKNIPYSFFFTSRGKAMLLRLINQWDQVRTA